MRMLLDTHVFLWWLTDDPRLSQPIRVRLASEANRVYVSAASIWEIAIKISIGKLAMKKKDSQRLADLPAMCGFSELPVSARHAAGVLNLPRHHADPFDRLLAVQALLEHLTIVTSDRMFEPYGIPTTNPS